jgi:hypothetical protein
MNFRLKIDCLESYYERRQTVPFSGFEPLAFSLLEKRSTTELKGLPFGEKIFLVLFNRTSVRNPLRKINLHRKNLTFG